MIEGIKKIVSRLGLGFSLFLSIVIGWAGAYLCKSLVLFFFTDLLKFTLLPDDPFFLSIEIIYYFLIISPSILPIFLYDEEYVKWYSETVETTGRGAALMAILLLPVCIIAVLSVEINRSHDEEES